MKQGLVSVFVSSVVVGCSLALLGFCPGKNWGNSHSNKQAGTGRIETAWLSSLTPRKSVWYLQRAKGGRSCGRGGRHRTASGVDLEMDSVGLFGE